MIHELAHYVPPMSLQIGDQAYFRKDPQKYRNLDPEKAYRNAIAMPNSLMTQLESPTSKHIRFLYVESFNHF